MELRLLSFLWDYFLRLICIVCIYVWNTFLDIHVEVKEQPSRFSSLLSLCGAQGRTSRTWEQAPWSTELIHFGKRNFLFYDFFPLHVCIHTEQVPGSQRYQKSSSCPLELELQMIVSHPTGAGKQTWIHYMNSKCSCLAKPFPKPCNCSSQDLAAQPNWPQTYNTPASAFLELGLQEYAIIPTTPSCKVVNRVMRHYPLDRDKTHEDCVASEITILAKSIIAQIPLHNRIVWTVWASALGIQSAGRLTAHGFGKGELDHQVLRIQMRESKHWL